MNLFKIIALVLAAIMLYLFVRVIDIQQVRAAVGQIGYNFIFLLLITGTAYWLATVGWKCCIAGNRQLSTADLFFVRHLGEMASIINPAGILGGEALKVYLLSEKGIDKSRAISSIMISRILMAASQILLFTITSVFILVSGNHAGKNIQFLPFPVGMALLLMLLQITESLRSINIKKIADTYSRSGTLARWLGKFKIQEIGTELRTFFRSNKKGLYLAVLFFSLHWIAGSLEIYFILKCLGIKAGILPVLFVDMGIVVFKSAGAFVPGQLGVEEFANKVMLSAIGLPDTEIWITVSVLRRARQLFWISFGGAVYLFFSKKHKYPLFS